MPSSHVCSGVTIASIISIAARQYSTRNSVLLAALTIALLSIPIAPAPSQSATKKDILILHSYHKGLEWTDSVDEGIMSALKARLLDIEVHTEYMDAKRISDGEYDSRLFDLLKLKYASIAFKVIITSDDDAYQFYLKYHDILFPGGSFCGVNY
jgi:hypothetical protein